MATPWDDDEEDDEILLEDSDGETSVEERLAYWEAQTDQEPELSVAEQMAAIEAERCQPKPYALKQTKKQLAFIDCETDPFAKGLVVKPFAVGISFPDRYVDFWGDDCVKQCFEYIATLEEEYIFYAHNGGKFDFFFFLDYLDKEQTPHIMNSRLVKIFFGGQEFRDSFAIIPQGLGSYQKDTIDYALFTRDKREKHKREILAYLKNDCIYLQELVVGFHTMFGDKLTIASAALPMLNSFHGFEKMSETLDTRFRDYYFGGRVQCFERGILKPSPGKKWKLYDRNSMYPAVMRDLLHPISNRPRLQRTIDSDTDFAVIDATSWGALPIRADNGSLFFPMGERRTYHATAHEIRAGLETNTLRIHRVLHAWAFDKKVSFEEFVNTFYGLRLDAKEIGDKVRDILYKLILNSSYGKFALNPRKFKQWLFTIGEVPKPLATRDEPNGWALEVQSGDIFIWSRPNPRRGGFYNVATAASITGGSRANLWRNIRLAERPIYCDTDSIICEGFQGALDDKALGGWKLEAEGTFAAIAGKKLYAFYDEQEVVKKAAKGVGISASDIVDICNGATVLFENPVPTFHMDGSADFISRRVRMTG